MLTGRAPCQKTPHSGSGHLQCNVELASFRQIALAPLWLQLHAKDPTVLGEANPGTLQRLLDADDGGDVALRRPLLLLDPRNGGEADFCSFCEVLLPPAGRL